jgi:Flp pilus assembly protein TadD
LHAQPAPDSGIEAEALHRQALALYQGGDVSGAIYALRKAVELQPANADSWNDLGVIERKTRGDGCRHRELSASDYV